MASLKEEKDFRNIRIMLKLYCVHFLSIYANIHEVDVMCKVGNYRNAKRFDLVYSAGEGNYIRWAELIMRRVGDEMIQPVTRRRKGRGWQCLSVCLSGSFFMFYMNKDEIVRKIKGLA